VFNQLADAAAQLGSIAARTNRQGSEQLQNILAEAGIPAGLDEALSAAQALDGVASQLIPEVADGTAPAADETVATDATDASGATDQPDAAPPTLAMLDSARHALALALNRPLEPMHGRAALAQQMQELANVLSEHAAFSRKAAEYAERAQLLSEEAREKLKAESAALGESLRQAAQDSKSAAQAAGNTTLAGPLSAAEQPFAEASAAVGKMGTVTTDEALQDLAGRLEQMAGQLEPPIGGLAAALGNQNDAHSLNARGLGEKVRDVAGRHMDLSEELRRADRANRLADAELQALSATREDLEARVRATLDALDQQGALPGALLDEFAALRNSVPAAPQEPAPGAEAAAAESASASARAARAESARMARMAGRIERLAGGLLEGRAAFSPPDLAAASRTPIKDAVRALDAARAAAETGNAARADELRDRVEALLRQAAQSVRAATTGKKLPGTPDTSSLAAGREPGAQNEDSAAPELEADTEMPGDGDGLGDGDAPAPAESTAVMIELKMPKGLPIDEATWNRLPDDLRRDLLNAAGGRFPAEYEASIRRYFKNLAATSTEKH
jgi:hypothetical protein